MLLAKRPARRLIDQDIYLFLQKDQLLLHPFDQDRHIRLRLRRRRSISLPRLFGHITLLSFSRPSSLRASVDLLGLHYSRITAANNKIRPASLFIEQEKDAGRVYSPYPRPKSGTPYYSVFAQKRQSGKFKGRGPLPLYTAPKTCYKYPRPGTCGPAPGAAPLT